MRERSCSLGPRESSGVIVDRVCHHLVELGAVDGWRVTNHGPHAVVTVRGTTARVTPLGQDAYGLAFRDARGRWAPMLLVDTLDAIVADLVAAVEPPTAATG